MEGLYLLCQNFLCHTNSLKDNRPIVIPLSLMLFHAKDIWHTMCVFQHGKGIPIPFTFRSLGIVLIDFNVLKKEDGACEKGGVESGVET